MEIVREAAVNLSDDDVLVLKPEQPVMYQQCCGCGLVYRVEVSERSNDLRFRFIRKGYTMPYSEFEPVTHLERLTGG